MRLEIPLDENQHNCLRKQLEKQPVSEKENLLNLYNWLRKQLEKKIADGQICLLRTPIGKY